MSTAYDLYCIPCNDGCGFDENHGEGRLNALVSAFPVIRAFYDAERKEFWCWEVDCGLNFGMRAAVHWWELHRDHHIVLRDEYGRMQELTPPEPHTPTLPQRYCPGCGWPNGKHAAGCLETEN